MAGNDTERPLTDSGHPQWRQGRISSGAGKERLGYAVTALIWNALAQPLFWLVIMKQADMEPMAVLLTGLFPLSGVWLAYLAAVKWLQWRRFGNLELAMDPFPGSVGGDVGGVIEIPISYRAGKTVELTLSCVNEVITRRRRKSRRHEKVVWREKAVLDVEPGLRGSRVKFRFRVPADQRPTSEPSDDAVKWVVHLHRKLPGADLDQTFELPVLDTATPQQSRHIRQYTSQATDAADMPESNVVMQRTAGGLHVFYPASRGRGMGFAMLLFGATFGVAPWFIAGNFSDFASADAFDMIFMAFGGFFTLIFGLIGFLLAALGVYKLFNSLEVNASGAGVVTTRSFLGIRTKQTLQRSDIDELRFRINAQAGRGAKASVHYLLEAVPVSGKPVCLGDAIKGKPLARRIMQELGSVLGHDEWREAKRRAAGQRAQRRA